MQKKTEFVIIEKYRNIDILYEDNHLLVVNKPPNMLSQSDHTGDRDLQSLLKDWIRDKYQKPGDVFLGLVQRLDRPTRGLMVLARTSKAASRLSDQIRIRTFHKEYLAVVVGKSVKTGELVHFLEKDANFKKAVVTHPARAPGVAGSDIERPRQVKNAKPARMNVTHLETIGALSLVKIILETGRFHQIRAQLAAGGTPVAGDRKYGASGGRSGSQTRQLALMCSGIAFEHPTRQKLMQFTLDLPDEYPWDQFRQA
jgi:23S rRNA pseudouridine1911/1915/1917 synthase